MRPPGPGPGRACSFLLLLLSTPACAPTLRVELGTLQTRIRTACDPMREVKLRARFRTDVATRTAEVKAAFDAGAPGRADTLASSLASDCSEEAERRRQLAPLIELAARRREVIPENVWQHFLELCEKADYTNAIVCGETLAQGSTSGCDLAPARARNQTRTIRKETPPDPDPGW
jgi:hypothetical protein